MIEHYNPGNALTGAPSGQTKVTALYCVNPDHHTLLQFNVQDSPDEESEDDESEVESILLDHQHEWWNMWALFRRVFKSHRFKVSAIVLHLNGTTFNYVVLAECSCGGSVPAILLKDEPEQHDVIAQLVDSHRPHHDHRQL